MTGLLKNLEKLAKRNRQLLQTIDQMEDDHQSVVYLMENEIRNLTIHNAELQCLNDQSEIKIQDLTDEVVELNNGIDQLVQELSIVQGWSE